MEPARQPRQAGLRQAAARDQRRAERKPPGRSFGVPSRIFSPSTSLTELHFITAPLHPWPQAGRVECGEISRQNYILYNKHSLTFRLIEDYFRRENMVLKTVIELGSMEATKELVKLGLGISILAPWIAQKEIEEGSLAAVPLGRRKLQRRWGILHARGKRLDLSEETFIGLCESATALLRARVTPDLSAELR